MTPAEIAELRRLCEAATPGPYSVRHGRDQASDVYTVLDGNDMWVADCGNAPQDAAFIAAARAALPAALDEVERLRKERDAHRTDAENLHREGGPARRELRLLKAEHAKATSDRDRLAAEAQRYAWATPAANVTRPDGCRCDLWPRGHCREGCPSGEVARLRALLREAVEIARDERWTSRPPEVRMAQLARLAALASEGGV